MNHGILFWAILLLLFAGYVREAIKGEEFEADLVGPAALIDTEFRDTGRRLWAVLLFVFAAFAIFVSRGVPLYSA